MNSLNIFQTDRSVSELAILRAKPVISTQATVSNGHEYTIETYNEKFRFCERVWLFLQSITSILKCDYSLSKRNFLDAWYGERTINLYLPLELEQADNERANSIQLDEAEVKINWSEIIPVLNKKPESLLENTPGTRRPEGRMKGHPEITECHCVESVHRIKRSNLETQLIEEIQKNHLTDKEICILSIGSGGLFQEMVIHARLVTLGYKVHWIFNDYFYESDGIDPENHPAIRTFKSLAAETGSRVSVLAKKIAQVLPTGLLHQIGSPDVILRVDAEMVNCLEISQSDYEDLKKSNYIHKNFVIGFHETPEFYSGRGVSSTFQYQLPPDDFIRYFSLKASDKPITFAGCENDPNSRSYVDTQQPFPKSA